MSAERFRLGIGRQNQEWPDDMTNSLAVMSPIPRRFADQFGGVRDLDGFDAYITEWQQDIAELLGPYLEPPQSGPPPFNFYLIPPAAGPYTDFIFTLAQDVHTVIQNLDGYIGLGGALTALARRRKERGDPDADRGVAWERPTYFYGSLRDLEAMCLYHAFQTYYDPGKHPKVEIQATSRGEFLGSVIHPTPRVQYTIKIRMGRNDFVYVVTADGRAVDHFAIRRGKLEGLTLPDWFEERRDGDVNRPNPVDPLLPSG